MKKYLLIAMACLSLVFGFASCKVGNAKVTVTVTDNDGNPVVGRKVYYMDMATAIIKALTPDPADGLRTTEEAMEDVSYLVTNEQGTATREMPMLVESIDFYFYVFDKGSSIEGEPECKVEARKIKQGEHAEITFKVNQ